MSNSSNNIYKNLGTRNPPEKVREVDDFYATDPIAAKLLLQNEKLYNVWECACGKGHLSEVFKDAGVLGISSDKVDRGYGITINFLNEERVWRGDIVTNPPYKYASEFIEKAISLVEGGSKVCMFLKIQFLEGKKRKELFKKYPPKTIYVSSSKILCAKNAEFERMKSGGGGVVAYAWFVWEKGFSGDPVVKWIN